MRLNNTEAIQYSAYELNKNLKINPKHVNMIELKYIHFIY